jgi:hypothetical protein
MTVPTSLNTGQLSPSAISQSKSSPTPRTVSVLMDFSAGGDIIYSLDIGQIISSGKLDQLTSIYVDNSLNNAQLVVKIPGSLQNLTVPPASQGFYPVLCGNSGALTFEMIGGIAQARVCLINVETPYLVWGSEGVAGFIFNGSGYALVSDPTLDATVVGGKVQTNDATMNALISGGALTTKDQGLDAIISGGTLAVTNTPAAGSFVHITTATTAVVKNAPGVIFDLIVNTLAAGTITIYNNTAASGAVLAVITVPATGNPFFIEYEANMTVGITVVTSVAMDVTVTYK